MRGKKVEGILKKKNLTSDGAENRPSMASDNRNW
jgi:hypothetical protein